MKGVRVLSETGTDKLKLLILNEPYRSLMLGEGSLILADNLPSITGKLYPCDTTKVVSVAIKSTGFSVDGNHRVLATAIALPPIEAQTDSEQAVIHGQLRFKLTEDDVAKKPQLNMIELSTSSDRVDVHVRQYEVLSGQLLFIRSDKEEEAYEISDIPLSYLRSDKEEENVYFLENNVAYIRSDKEEETA